MISLAAINEAFREAYETTPWPPDNELARRILGLPRRTYRERLDAQPCNCYGRVIPRIAIVRRNLARLKAGASR